MANDRIYLMCKGCATHITLYKYYCTEDSSYCPVNQEVLDKFISDHLFECQQKWGADLQNDPGFVIISEGNDYEEAASKYRKVEVDSNGNKG